MFGIAKVEELFSAFALDEVKLVLGVEAQVGVHRAGAGLVEGA